MAEDFQYQISDKIGDLIFLVRGNNADEVVDDYMSVKALLDGVLPNVAAVQAVTNTFPGAQVVEQSSGNNCVHGPMQYKSGTAKNGKRWEGYFCPQGRNSGCEVKWA